MTLTSGVADSTTQSNNFLAGEDQATVEAAITGNNPHIFRVAQTRLDHTEPLGSVRVTGEAQRLSTEMAELSPTVTEHETITGVPFTANYYRMDQSYKQLDSLDQARLKHIDSYLKQSIATGKYEDAATTGVALLKQLEKEIGLADHHSVFYKLEKLTQYLDVMADYEKHEQFKSLVTGQRNRDGKGRFL